MAAAVARLDEDAVAPTAGDGEGAQRSGRCSGSGAAASSESEGGRPWSSSLRRPEPSAAAAPRSCLPASRLVSRFLWRRSGTSLSPGPAFFLLRLTFGVMPGAEIGETLRSSKRGTSDGRVARVAAVRGALTCALSSPSEMTRSGDPSGRRRALVRGFLAAGSPAAAAAAAAAFSLAAARAAAFRMAAAAAAARTFSSAIAASLIVAVALDGPAAASAGGCVPGSSAGKPLTVPAFRRAAAGAAASVSDNSSAASDCSESSFVEAGSCPGARALLFGRAVRAASSSPAALARSAS
mmetsp:Transcript_20688/g.36478  ORF Transcript_20688/g.36478 Transcript_20688/m.36478 type:complete len:295 (+) Transcript_20688:268-1152(+)